LKNQPGWVKAAGWLALACVYLLTLLTQLPHIYDVYTALERQSHRILGVDTALGASIAFEASVAIFTLRTILNTKATRSRWTRPGIVAFLLISALANTSYYFDVALVDGVLMPAVLTAAIPLALWLYAEEFGADAKSAIRAQGKTKEEPQPAQDAPPPTPPEPQPTASISDWRAIVAASNGDFRSVDATRIEAALVERGLAPPAERTMQGWAKRTNEGALDI